MYVDPVSTDITRSLAETPPQSASVLTRIFRTMAEEYERIARDYENQKNYRVEIDHYSQRDILVAVEIEKGKTLPQTIKKLTEKCLCPKMMYAISGTG